MNIEDVKEFPFRIKFSFDTLIHQLQKLVDQDKNCNKEYQAILEEAKQFPEIMDEVAPDFFVKNEAFMKRLLSVVFPPLLTENEIKAVNMPFFNMVFNPTKRLQKILEDAGTDFHLTIDGYEKDQFYILCCTSILVGYYQQPFKTDFQFVYDIPNKEGFMNHYRILTNGDFMELLPTETAKILTQDEIDELMDNFENIALWKEKFPPNSWEMRGFGIVSMYDATTEVAVSNLKSLLIQRNEEDKAYVQKNINTIFRSLFRFSELEVGFTAFNTKESKFEISPMNNAINSKILADKKEEFLDNMMNEDRFMDILGERKYLVINDIAKYLKENPNSFIARTFTNHNIESVILAPIFNDKEFLGVLEVVSSKKKLNYANAAKLDNVLPFLEMSINQLYTNLDNYIVSIIQQEYTSIHQSVYWKFHDEAVRHVGFEKGKNLRDLAYRSISFKELIPIYGQSDIKNSSNERNNAIINDLKYQLDMLVGLIGSLETETDLSDLEEKICAKKKELNVGLKASTESELQLFISEEINPVLQKLKFEGLSNNRKITNYFQQLDTNSNFAFLNKNRFDDSVTLINKELTDLLDQRQEEQQQKFPFYYERFKTDGVEHNIYSGSSIAPWLTYDPVFLQNLRIWHLRVMVESEVYFQQTIKKNLPLDLDITSLILAYGTPISIRFRMDEKRFDVDGSYNARYEIIKKRIDKALLKNTNQRLVQVGKMSVVFAQQKEKDEYLNYIKILQDEGLLLNDVEVVELEDLQGIIGLKAIRVGIDYTAKTFEYPFFNNPKKQLKKIKSLDGKPNKIQ